MAAQPGDPDVHAVLRPRHRANLGKSNLSGKPVPSTCSTSATRCCSSRLSRRSTRRARARRSPPKFTHRKKASVCLVYFAPEHGTLVAISFRPTQDFDAITWTGPVRSREGQKAKQHRGVWPPGPTRRTIEACPADPRPADRAHAGRARADGGHHQRGLPPAVRRAGRRPLRLRDDHQPRAGRGRRDDPEDAGLRRAGDRSGPCSSTAPTRSYVGKATEILCAEYGVAPRRPQLRLPGAQGDPQGRRGSAAVEARAARRDPASRRSPPPRRTACRSR